MTTSVEKYENCHEKSTSVLGPDVAEHRKAGNLPRKMHIEEVEPPKKPKKYEFYSENPVPDHPTTVHRKVRELPGKMNIEEVEAKKYENYHAKPVSDPFKSTPDTRKVRELPRKIIIEEVEEPETTKKHRQNPSMPAAATRKLRKFTDKTHMQARNHENSDAFCPPPRSSHPGFSYYIYKPET